MEVKKNILVVYDGIPNPNSGGGAFTVFSIIDSLLKKGYFVNLLLLLNEKKTDFFLKKELENLKKIVSLHIIFIEEKINFFQKIHSKISLSWESVFPKSSLFSKIEKKVKEINPDVIFVYHFDALAGIYKLKNFPKISIVGDPPYEVVKYRFRYFLKKLNYKHFLLSFFYPVLKYKYKRGVLEMLNHCEIKGAFAAHHAQELEKEGVKNCIYFRTPVKDYLLPEDKLLIGQKNNSLKFKILLFGNLKGIVTITGIELLINEILPILKKEIGEKNFEIHLAGRYFEELPLSLQKKMQVEPVKIRGFLEDLKKEIFSSDIVLIPTPIELGVRVRAITAMSYGACIVIHSANQKGIPELEDGKNCLIGTSGKELAQKIIGCYKGIYDLAKIRKEARITYENYFEANKATEIIISHIKKLCLKN